jgi:hypothetical protein
MVENEKRGSLTTGIRADGVVVPLGDHAAINSELL